MTYFCKETNIKLRKINKYDLNLLLEIKNESWFGTHQISILNIEDQTKWFESLDSDPHTPKSLFLIGEISEVLEENKMSYMCCFGLFKFNKIDWYHKYANVGWDIHKNFRNKGLGKKIIKAGINFSKEVLNLNRLTAEILETNHASIKCAEHNNFILEGTKQKEILKNNKYINNHIYGLLLN